MKNEEMLTDWEGKPGPIVGIDNDNQVMLQDTDGRIMWFSAVGERQLREYLIRRSLSQVAWLAPPRHECKSGACRPHPQNTKYRWAVFHRWPKDGSPVEMKTVHAASLEYAVDTFKRMCPGAAVLAVNFLDEDVKAGFGSKGPNVGQGTA